ncbi:MAG: ethanolamine ammonia-lyase subunit EutC [Gammaproteobacteria bacterium]|nr:ethanolamine ammonia-lyase subunit EutC [Gammaproteobacteria bacterium]MBU1846328.1 ethanolamine ammonia-lyase subunit EutC [Gammaproteobacteria bacterium]
MSDAEEDKNLTDAADAWAGWRSHTPARIGLGRVGTAVPTSEALGFGLAHALARDAIHTPLDVSALASALRGQDWPAVSVKSRAPDRETYLRRPDLGRRLDPDDRERLAGLRGDGCDLAVVIGDGLSSAAVARHAVPLLGALYPLLPADWVIAPVIIATQARVALADEAGEALGARMVAMLIGERPGLSSPDSLGIYLTYAPVSGRSDAERNCISNVRPQGQGYGAAAYRLSWLMQQAVQVRLTGVGLKDESDSTLARVPAGLRTRLSE